MSADHLEIPFRLVRAIFVYLLRSNKLFRIFWTNSRDNSFVSTFFLAREWNNKNLPARFFLLPPPLPSTINLN